jgi:2-polyprenyl-6-methoxyphenol hydroxylase-like FAD-dependent oxidoreductase
MILESLLPGLSDELCGLGAVRVDAGRDFAWHHSGGWRMRSDSGLSFLSMSRPLLESRIERRVRALPNVSVVEGIRAGGLRVDANGRVTGVRLSEAGRPAPANEIEADLVVDATGRGSATPEWLRDLGFRAPSTELVGARVAYASCTFRRGDRRATALIISGRPARRSGLLFPIEDERWLVTLPGFFDEPMPHDIAAFHAYARSLAAPDLHNMIHDCKPLSEIRHYRFSGSLRHRYEQLEHFPEGLIVVGDAVCSFNPVYGQGMTVSAIEAEALGRLLADARTAGGLGQGFARRWFGTIKPVVDAAWKGGLLEDSRLPELANRRPISLRPMQWYMERVHRATHRSALVTDQFYRIMNFLDPPTRLFRPRIMAELMRTGFARSAERIRPAETRPDLARSGHAR